MDVTFSLQDPTDPDTTYLFEAIVAAASGSSRWWGMYAFATRNGVDNLLGDPAIEAFLHGGGDGQVVVGIDAITNRVTLERLLHFQAAYPGFKPRVFWNSENGLFHPKLSIFEYPDGRRTLVLGSGNLTPGGFQSNFEAYTVISAAPGEALDLSSFDEFLLRHAANIRAIDNAALVEAAKNVVKITKKPPAAPPPIAPAAVAAAPAAVTGLRVLVAQVPRAGGRWQQIHLNADVVHEFFRVTDTHAQRVFLTPVSAAGMRGDEEVKPIVYSAGSNKNYKLESSKGKGEPYPAGTPPIIVYLERQLRTFDYILVMPDAAAYPALLAITTGYPAIGKGLPRVILDVADFQAAWPTSPLLTAPPPVADDGA